MRITLLVALTLAARPFAAQADPEPPEVLAELLSAITPDEGPARPPFDLARQDMGLDPSKGEGSGTAAERTHRALAALRKQALARQTALVERWLGLQRAAWRPESRPHRAAWALVAYAMGKGELADARDAAQRAGTDARLRLARLLLAECRFDTAVAVLVDVASGSSERFNSGSSVAMLT